jgi:hypothetical protein
MSNGDGRRRFTKCGSSLKPEGAAGAPETQIDMSRSTLDSSEFGLRSPPRDSEIVPPMDIAPRASPTRNFAANCGPTRAYRDACSPPLSPFGSPPRQSRTSGSTTTFRNGMRAASVNYLSCVPTLTNLHPRKMRSPSSTATASLPSTISAFPSTIVTKAGWTWHCPFCGLSTFPRPSSS